MSINKRLWWLSRPIVWAWRGCPDWDASKVALCMALTGFPTIAVARADWREKHGLLPEDKK
jgi:hypothetical protein